ncbi:GNAT family N-acetyltransferase [Actinocrispum wychmicini]|uniref:Ribosomal protein S18 acetylase RimI-like enzyme n=1 Tax=Actinocrispum wychmicini TaxID=1213861 RepID=A0A4R2JNH1_9PSEU|nr:GNAT family N-acetyltransferase [Actinocrispum wychmicini]TCO60507.1 ribosomal protein S18 acetylase RimI-like enzyme [Actinocrispum wychmicini]
MVLVTPAKIEHIETIAVLLEETDAFYGVTEFAPLEQRVRQVREALFGAVPAAQLLLAWDENQLVGLASYSFLWPAADLTRSLFLKELYVSRTHWRCGVGRLLMHSLFEAALQHNCSRVEWMTDEDNAGAREFYETLGLPRDSSKVFYRMEGEALRRTFGVSSDGLPG